MICCISMIKATGLFPLISLVMLIFVSNANAAKLYRCDGRVQYRPCEQKLHNYEVTYKETSKPRYRYSTKTKQRGAKYVRVVRQSLRKITLNEGLWRGYVEGNGMVQLMLDIFRGGTRESRRIIGSLPLHEKDGQVLFHFRSSLPKGFGWSWKISGSAK